MEEKKNEMAENMTTDRGILFKIASESERMKNGVTIKDGKMMRVKNGEMTSMDEDMTLSNETKIMTDGTIMKKDGTKMIFKEGEHIDMSGIIIPIKNS